MTAGSQAPAPFGLPSEIQGRQVKYWKQLKPFRSDDETAEAPFIPIFDKYSTQSLGYQLNKGLWKLEKKARKTLFKILRL